MDQLEELSQIFRVLGFLGVLGCLAYILTKLLNKRDWAKKAIHGKSGIVPCDTRSLGNKQFLVVAEYEKERFLLGISSGSIKLLAKLNTEPLPTDLASHETVS